MNPVWRGVGNLCLVLGAVGMCGKARAVTPLTTERVATGLTRPLFVTAPPGDTARVFIVEQRGSAGNATRGDIKILNLGSGTINATPFLSVFGLSFGDEQGLLGLAFAPDYVTSGRFYVNYTDSAGDSHIARGTVSGDPDVANPALTDVLFINQPFSNHNGGWLGFGPDDGYLYASFGDGGSANDPGDRAQNLNTLLGKILRLDVSGATYTNPPDNPFFGAATGLDEIWASGMRNPWRLSHDRLTADLWIGDVGQGTWEEVDFEPASSAGGVNYGWRCREGAHPFDSSTTNPCGSCSSPACPLTDPIYEYNQAGFLCAVTCGYVYRGCAIPDLRGTFIFGDYYCDFSATAIAPIWSFRYLGGTVTQFMTRTTELDPPGALVINSVTSFGQDADGELYICDRGGDVYKIIPAATPDPPSAYDYDNDGDLDLFDIQGLAFCNNGEGDAYPDCLCDVFDQDTDGDVDLVDYAAFQNQFRI